MAVKQIQVLSRNLKNNNNNKGPIAEVTGRFS